MVNDVIKKINDKIFDLKLVKEISKIWGAEIAVILKSGKYIKKCRLYLSLMLK